MWGKETQLKHIEKLEDKEENMPSGVKLLKLYMQLAFRKPTALRLLNATWRQLKNIPVTSFVNGEDT